MIAAEGHKSSWRNRGNSSDLGVCLSSMPVNWIGQVAIRVLSRRSRGDFQPIHAKSTSCSTSSPWPPSPGQSQSKGSDKRNSDLRIWSISHDEKVPPYFVPHTEL